MAECSSGSFKILLLLLILLWRILIRRALKVPVHRIRDSSNSHDGQPILTSPARDMHLVNSIPTEPRIIERKRGAFFFFDFACLPSLFPPSPGRKTNGEFALPPLIPAPNRKTLSSLSSPWAMTLGELKRKVGFCLGGDSDD